MKKQYTICALPALRFRRWSRRRYAVLLSRQRACTMGTLRNHIVERLQHKNDIRTIDMLVVMPLGKEDSPLWYEEENGCEELLSRMASVRFVQRTAVAAPDCIDCLQLIQSGKYQCKTGAFRFVVCILSVFTQSSDDNLFEDRDSCRRKLDGVSGLFFE